MPRARQILKFKQQQSDGATIEIVIWELPEPVPPCTHCFKYRMYFGAEGTCRIRHDNERGKGDHRHVGRVESAYSFSTIEALLDDFNRDVAQWRPA